ncbi:MAG: hypothetical protein IKY83_14820 [Proteobacteria bacterium]|nr:hypothetical protein [Pseudomonadota bacterium]
MRKSRLLFAFLAAIFPMTGYAQDGASEAQEAGHEAQDAPSTETVHHIVKSAPVEDVEHTFSDEQILLNNQAVDAVSSGNYSKAEQLFNSMLQIGEFNIIWMNLGRTYANQNKCIEAKDAYAHVFTAPKIDDFPSDMINQTTETFIKELDAQCSSTIVLTCSPADMTISIDSGREMPCTSEPLAVAPGLHSVFGKTSYGFNTIAVETVKDQTVNAEIEVVDYKKVAAEAGESPEELLRKSKIYKSVGYSLLGVGVAMAAGGFGWWGYSYNLWQSNCGEAEVLNGYQSCGGNEGIRNAGKVNGKSRADIEKAQITGGVVGAIGSAMIITGVTFVLIDALSIYPKYKEAAALHSFRISPVLMPEFSGMSLSARF